MEAEMIITVIKEAVWKILVLSAPFLIVSVFLGLIIANLSRQLLKTYRHTQLILGSTLFGMVVLVGGQLIVEHLYSYQVPVSVFITVGGGLYFLYLLLTQKKV